MNCHCLYNQICDSSGACIHKPIWPPNSLEICAYVLIPILIGISNVGGLGGSIIRVPILMVMLNYVNKQSTFIAFVILFGSCLPNCILLLRKKHSLDKTPVVNFNVVLILLPNILVGNIYGIFLTVIVADLVIVILYVCYLLFVTYFLLKKGIALYK